MYFIQKLELSTRRWTRIDNYGCLISFDCRLDALERCDELNEDVDPGLKSFGPLYRVVDEDAEVQAYSHE